MIGALIGEYIPQIIGGLFMAVLAVFGGWRLKRSGRMEERQKHEEEEYQTDTRVRDAIDDGRGRDWRDRLQERK